MDDMAKARIMMKTRFALEVADRDTWRKANEFKQMDWNTGIWVLILDAKMGYSWKKVENAWKMFKEAHELANMAELIEEAKQ